MFLPKLQLRSSRCRSDVSCTLVSVCALTWPLALPVMRWLLALSGMLLLARTELGRLRTPALESKALSSESEVSRYLIGEIMWKLLLCD